MHFVPVFVVALVILSGCSNSSTTSSSPSPAPTPPVAAAVSGVVKSGEKPISGAHIYLFATNTTGYGQPSVSLLDAASAGASDGIGAYVLSDSTGSFSIPTFTCTSNSQLYLYSLGGNAGTGANGAAGLMGVLGTCPSSDSFHSSLPTVSVNEVTTIAAAFALAGFATDATHVSSSGTALAQTGVANAFLNAGNLVSVATGEALSMIPSGNARAPQAKVNTLANILATCVDSSGASSTSCSSLFADALLGGAAGNAPTNTANAAINIAHNPSVNVRTLYDLVTTNGPFSPGLTSAPGDLALGLYFIAPQVGSPGRIAIDAAGAAWFLNQRGIVKLSSSGTFLSGQNGFTGGGLTAPFSIAIDDNGNAWVTDTSASGRVVEFSNSGTVLSGASGYGTGQGVPRQIAIDGNGNAWVTTEQNSVVKLSSSGAVLSGSGGFTASGLTSPDAIAIDGSGNAWVSTLSGSDAIFEISNTGSFLSGQNGYPVGIDPINSVSIDNMGSVWTQCGGCLAIKIGSSGTTLLTAAGSGGNGIAIDGAGNAWVTEITDTVVRGLSNSGSPISGTFGYNGGVLTNPLLLALDGSGDAWVVNETSGSNAGFGLSELIGVTVPVITPIATGVKNNTLGTRP
jgi:streptogramin lyase